DETARTVIYAVSLHDALPISDYVMDFVARAGVKHVFMLAGGGCMHLADSLGTNAQLDYVCCLHEQACAFAAEAYAEYTNELGVRSEEHTSELQSQSNLVCRLL